MNKNFIFLTLISVSILVMLASLYGLYQVQQGKSIIDFKPSLTHALIFYQGETKVAVNQPFKLSIMIDPKGQAINAAGIYLYYEPDKLTINDIKTTESFCQFYPEKKFDNRLGQLSLACGSPHPGINQITNLATLEIMPHVIGTTVIRLSNQSKILRSDGKGTNLLFDYPYQEITIRASY